MMRAVILTFTSNKAITTFGIEDITRTNGTFSGFTTISPTVYRVTLNRLGAGNPYNVSVAQGAYTDAAGNSNNPSNLFNWTYDGINPEMIITVSDPSDNPIIHGGTTNQTVFTVAFISSEATTNFTEGDIVLTNGTLSNFTVDSTTSYNATFTATLSGECSISVPAGAYTDAAGNNNIIPDPNTSSITFTSDNQPPSMTITANNPSNIVVTDGSTTNAAFIYLSFVSSKTTTDFIASDISLTNGSISNFSGSGTTYTATFTPTGEGLCQISVAGGVFTDSLGTNNSASNVFDWTSDTTSPKAVITATKPNGTTVSSGSTTNDANLLLTFTTEATINFTQGDIATANGEISNFVKETDTRYTATFIPQFAGQCTIDVNGGSYTDLAENINIASDQFIWTFDNAKPDMTITAKNSSNITVSSGTTTDDSNLLVTFTSTKLIEDGTFTSSDITVSNGLISVPSKSSGFLYTSTFTPTAIGLCTIDVLGGVYQDTVGNVNNVAPQFQWNFDNSPISMDIEVKKVSGTVVSPGSTTVDPNLTVKFTSNKAVAAGTFIVTDISLVNGTLSSFATVNTNIYTATFTPDGDGSCNINIAANKFTDINGNNNSASSFSWSSDTSYPLMSISAKDPNENDVNRGATTNDSYLKLTFTSNETTSNFDESDITVTDFFGNTINGLIGTFLGSGTTYTARFSPTQDGTYQISVAGGAFTDTGGNPNMIDTFTWTRDTTDLTMMISATNLNGMTPITSGSTTNDASIALTFTSSKATNDFIATDISVTNGSISNFSGSGTTYSATFTPTAAGATTIDVAGSKFTDAAGNNNSAATRFNWTYDNVPLTMAITSTTMGVTDGSTTNDASIELTFTSSKATTDFIAGDITVSGGNLTNFAATSSTVYTATFTPSASGPTTIDVAASTFTDAVGNSNLAATQF